MGATRTAGQGKLRRSPASARALPSETAVSRLDSRFGSDDASLYTSSGTLAYLDEASRRLRHGPAQAVPHNLALRAEGAACRVLAAPAHGGSLLSCILPAWDAGPCVLESLDHPFRFIRHDPGPGLIALHHAGAVLCAEPNGRLSLLPQDASPQAHFSPVCRRTVAIRDALLSGRWLDADAGTTVRISGVPGNLNPVAIGSVPVPLPGLPGPFVTEPESGPLLAVTVAAPGGLLLRLRRYRPLVYFTLFGTDRYFDCLTLALQSLQDHGAYDGDICIAADRPRSWIAGIVPDTFRQRWIHVRTDPFARLFSRYDMTEWGLQAFQPILYLDVDVVANAPIAPLLQRLALSPALHLATENRLLPRLAGKPASAYAATATGDWFGTWLCEGDPRFLSRSFALGSSGILGFANVATVRNAFAVIRALRRTADPARIAAFTDQALANYALHCLGGADFELIDRCVDFVRGRDPTPKERRGLVHFHSGVGDADGKYAAMRQYLSHLAETGLGI